jgi:hypothetical protein
VNNVYSINLKPPKIAWVGFGKQAGAPDNDPLSNAGAVTDPLQMVTTDPLTDAQVKALVNGTLNYIEPAYFVFQYRLTPVGAGNPIILDTYNLREYKISENVCTFTDAILSPTEIASEVKRLVPR